MVLLHMVAPEHCPALAGVPALLNAMAAIPFTRWHCLKHHTEPMLPRQRSQDTLKPLPTASLRPARPHTDAHTRTPTHARPHTLTLAVPLDPTLTAPAPASAPVPSTPELLPLHLDLTTSTHHPIATTFENLLPARLPTLIAAATEAEVLRGLRTQFRVIATPLPGAAVARDDTWRDLWGSVIVWIGGRGGEPQSCKGAETNTVAVIVVVGREACGQG